MSQTLNVMVNTIPQPSNFRHHYHDAIHRDYALAKSDRLAFWGRIANELTWSKSWTKVLDWNRPHAKWFYDGTLNAAHNCLDIHANRTPNKPAIIWASETGDTNTISYKDLLAKVCQLGSFLQTTGNVSVGDRVTIYMPMIPEAVIAMLACARIGAIHSVVFAGFSAPSLAERINDSSSSCIITAHTAQRKGQTIPLRDIVWDALSRCSRVASIITVNRPSDTHQTIPDYDWDSACKNQPTFIPPIPVNSEHPLFILYTSGTTGRPKGIMHSTGGYLAHAKYSTKLVFDLQENDIFWCTADVGWITGHTYVVYGPLSNGASIFMYEGTPDYPTMGQFWACIERHKPTIFYTAPTAIRLFMKHGADIPNQYDLSSLRLLGTVGEPINPDAWLWYYRVIGQSLCPVVDTWWQTETGGIMLTAIPGYHQMKPGIAGQALPGIGIDTLNESGTAVQNERGLLSITQPWPSMLRGIWGNQQRYNDVYWHRFTTYFAGDGSVTDSDGDVCVIGRVDDVLNVSGHRIGTMEVESALVSHPTVAEAAVIGRSDALKGEAIAAFVILTEGCTATSDLSIELMQHVSASISPIAKPSHIIITPELPKTRSGKIMRRILRQLMEKEPIGDTTTLANPTIIPILEQAISNQLATLNCQS